MKDNGIGRFTRSFGLSLAITCVFSALLVIVKETGEHTVMPFMAKLTGHHWVTHGIFDLIVFVVLGFLLARTGGSQGAGTSGKSLVTLIISCVVVSGIIIAGFYLMD